MEDKGNDLNSKEYKLKFNKHLRNVLRKARTNYLARTSPTRIKYTREKEEAILEVIRIYGIKGGILHNQLAHIVDLDRKSLRPYTKNLLQTGRIRREGRRGKYFPTEESYKDPLLKAGRFGDNFRHRLLNQENDLVLFNGIIADSQLKKLFDCSFPFTHYYKPMFKKEDIIERAFFEFSNRVGAFVTYSLIQAMNPDNNNTSSLSPVEQDHLVKKCAENAISRILPFLVSFFRDLVVRATNRERKEIAKAQFQAWLAEQNNSIQISPYLQELNKFAEENATRSGEDWLDAFVGAMKEGRFGEPQSVMTKSRFGELPWTLIQDEDYDYDSQEEYKTKKNPQFVFDKETVNKLLPAFNRLYTRLGYEFDKIIRDLPKDIEYDKKYREYIHEKWKRQETCEHQYKKLATMTLYGYYGRQCSKCGYIKKVKMPVTETKRKNKR